MTKLVQFGLADIAATTPYVLIDKSDVTNFPHAVAEDLEILRISVQGEAEGTNPEYYVRIGVLEEVDATDGTTHWIFERRFASVGRFDWSREYGRNGRGLALTVDAENVISSAVNASNTNFQSDETIANPTGSDVAPAAGDLVMEVVEVAGTGTVSLDVEIEYQTVGVK